MLFYKGEPVSKSFLIKILGIEKESLESAIKTLRESFKDRGIVLVENNEALTLGTSPEVSEVIEGIEKEETDRDLTSASLETLSIILYKSPISRSEIDFIRGVNSTFILRSLLIRGLIDRKTDPHNHRSYIYQPSVELLGHLGITSVKELPKRDEVLNKIEEFKINNETMNSN